MPVNGVSSMVSIAAFGPGDPGSNPGWFAVQIQIKKISDMNNTCYNQVLTGYNPTFDEE